MHRGFFRSVNFKSRADKHIPIPTSDATLLIQVESVTFCFEDCWNIQLTGQGIPWLQKDNK